MPKIWTIISGGDDANVFFSEEERDRAIIETIKGYKSNPGDEGMTEELMAELRADDPDCIDLVVVTINNWQDVLDRLNAAMDENGEAHYLCVVKEHEVSPEHLATLISAQENEASPPAMR